MENKNQLRLFLPCFFLLTLLYTKGFSQSRVEETINSGWLFHRGDMEIVMTHQLDSQVWKPVNLPHTWNDVDVLPENRRGYYRGISWYRKKINNFNKSNHKRYYLYFEGANQETDVYINQQFVGNHKGGYTGFCFDITDFMVNGDNTLAVKVDNQHRPNIPPLSADFTFFGGIYRDVKLIATSSVHLDLGDHGSNGVFVESPLVTAQQAQIAVRCTVVNESSSSQKITLSTTVKDQKGRIVTSFGKEINLKPGERTSSKTTSDILSSINLWSPESPYLYQVETQVISNGQIIDEVINPLGFRWYKFDANTGFYLNGKPLKLMGANRHQDYWRLGNALTDEIHRNDLQLLKEMGGNFIRLAHYPQDPAILEQADKLGIMVWEEIPLVNEITLSEEHHQISENMLKEMVRQHYNHPSIIMWGYMNEIYWKHRFIDSAKVDQHTQQTINLAKRLEALTRKEDPNRYTGMALHNFPLYEQTNLGDIPMVVGWNLYHGWYYDNFEDFGKFMDEQHKLHPNRIHMISEFGAGSDPRVHTQKPIRFDFSMEGQKAFSESFLNQISARKYIAGATVWNLIDFSSELRVDATPRLNNKGLATTDRRPKDPYYLFQAALSEKPIIKIAETNYLRRSINLTQGENFATEQIDVYSNMDHVDLLVDGKSQGIKPVLNHKASWSIKIDITNLYQLTANGTRDGSTYSDHLELFINIIPYRLTKAENLDLAVNTGSHLSFLDPYSNLTWLPDRAYSKGNWGYIYKGNPQKNDRITSLEDIYNTEMDPLYQSMRVGMSAYQFDVSDGWYELELLAVEPLPKVRRFADSPEPPPHPGGLRIFSVDVNGHPIFENLDLIKEMGYNFPMRKKIKVKAHSDKGITISFSPTNAIISGLKIRRLN